MIEPFQAIVERNPQNMSTKFTNAATGYTSFNLNQLNISGL
jgi:hypothetical protein